MPVLPDITLSVNLVVQNDPSPPRTCKAFMPLSVTSLRARARPSKSCRQSVGWQHSVNVSSGITIRNSNIIEVGRILLQHHENFRAPSTFSFPKPSRFLASRCDRSIGPYIFLHKYLQNSPRIYKRTSTDWIKAFQLSSPPSVANLIVQ